jgi:hypothetical protein
MLTIINMKNISVRTLALIAATVALLGWAGTGSVFADIAVTIHSGGPQGPPPQREDYQPWQSPDSTAVWIPGHHEWNGAQYVWVGGYYGYPPHRHSHWVAPSYPHNQDGYAYHPGHWSD